jgi:hypothetical protein
MRRRCQERLCAGHAAAQASHAVLARGQEGGNHQRDAVDEQTA